MAYPPLAVALNAAKMIKKRVLVDSLPFSTQRSRMGAMLMAVRVPKGATRSIERVGGITCEVHRPVKGGIDHTLMLIHGGGFCVGTPQMSRAWAAALSASFQATVVLPDYPLSPEAAFPEAADAVGAVWEVLASRGEVGLLGDSAGANLALGLAQKLVGTPSAPGVLVLSSPWLDLSVDRSADATLAARDPMLSAKWLAACADAYAPDRLDDPGVSPLLGSLAGLPPTLVIGGTEDVLSPDLDRLVAGWEGPDPIEAEIVKGMWHDFALQVGLLKAADEALEVTLEFLATHLSVD